MAQPYNYMIDIGNPVQSALQGYQAAQNMQLNQERIAAVQARRQQEQEMLRQQQEQQRRIQEFAAIPNKTYEDYARFNEQNPLISKVFDEQFSRLTEKQKQGEIFATNRLFNLLKSNNVDAANMAIDERMEAYRNSGDEEQAKFLEMMKEQLNIGEEGRQALMDSAGTLLAHVDPNFKDYMERQQARGKSGFQKGASFFLKNPTTGEVLPASTVFDEETGKIKTESGKIPEGFQLVSETGETPDEAQKRRIAEQAGKTEAEKAANNAAEIGMQAYNAMKSMAPIDEAIALVEDAIKTNTWVGTGPINKFLPKFNYASQALLSIANRMALGELSQATMGAISEKELDFIQAASFPEGMKKEDILVWLKNKKAATEKMANVLTDISLRVGRVNQETNQVYTMADWLRDRREKFSKSSIIDLSSETAGKPKDLKSLSVEERKRMLRGG